MSNQTLGQAGVLQVIPPAQLELQLNQQAKAKAAAADQSQQPQTPARLIGYIKGQWEIFRNHRNTSAGWSERLLVALRAFNGQYDANKLNEIRRFGGSEVYARTIAQKCRAASSLLRDIYLGEDRPWGIRPPANPAIPDNILQAIDQLMAGEAQQVMAAKGAPPNPDDVNNRRAQLLEQATDAAKKKAAQQARDSEDKVEDVLREGFFYHALAEFIVDLPIFPFACLKGPQVKIIPTVTWSPGGGMPKIVQTPKLVWNRISPFDLWWTPGVADIQYADIIEKGRVTRAEVNDLLDLPGYNQDEVRAVLEEYGRGGLYDNWDTTDAERAVLENRENPAWNRSAMLSIMMFTGHVQGRLLQDYGVPGISDPDRDYFVQAWCIGTHVIKCQLNPSPRQRHNYYLTSFEKVPGTPIGNGLTDMLQDLQEVSNATLRALVNNMSIASGPQVMVHDDRLTPDETGEDLYPWKRWHLRNDPAGNNTRPAIEFFQPQAIADQLLRVFQAFIEIADDVSAIPKYIGGQAGAGGAGRTASGLAMLMGNASKILQTVSANIDRDVLEPVLLNLVDMILLTDNSGMLSGEERISVKGVSVAVQRETIRQRQIEWLQATNNPTDMRILGLKGRGAALRAVSSTIGLDGEDVVPPEEQLEAMQAQEQQQQQQGPIMQRINEGVNKGVGLGVQRITTEMTAGELAQRLQMPEGAPTHIGTPPGTAMQPGSAGTAGPGTPEAARQSQGNLPSLHPGAGGGMGPNSASVAAPTPTSQTRISPGVG